MNELNLYELRSVKRGHNAFPEKKKKKRTEKKKKKNTAPPPKKKKKGGEGGVEERRGKKENGKEQSKEEKEKKETKKKRDRLKTHTTTHKNPVDSDQPFQTAHMLTWSRHFGTSRFSTCLIHYQTTNFRFFQTERACRRQFQI